MTTEATVSDDATQPGAVALTEGLGLVPGAQDEYSLDLFWHALNYRTAHMEQAEAMWRELEACVERKIAAAVAAERERCAELQAAIEAVERYCGYVMRNGTVNEQGVARTVLNLLMA